MPPAALGRPLPPILPWPCLQRGSTVIDPFVGTGSTGVAAIGADRVFTGITKITKHFATAVARITAAYEAAQAESLRHV